jgi:ubiquinone/menaquinone biosynthesis C-methylase UbiE
VSKSDELTFDRLAAPYDRGMAPLEKLCLHQIRTRLLPHAAGKVLEIGVGTGATFPFYPPVACLTAIDESAEMLVEATRRALALDQDVRLAQMDAEHLAFPSGHFDTVVATLVLCSVIDQQQALRELWRALHKPGGQLLLLEHMRPHIRPLAWLVDLANIPWHAASKRCHLNRRTQQAIVDVGFQLERVDTWIGGFFRLIVARTA